MVPAAPDTIHHAAHGSGHETRRVVLWRHGRTEWNNQKRFQGHLDVPLDAVGHQQAVTAARALATLRPDRIVTSDPSRAAQTAAALAAVTGVTVVEDAGLREAHAGDWQGRTHAEIRALDPQRLQVLMLCSLDSMCKTNGTSMKNCHCWEASAWTCQ